MIKCHSEPIRFRSIKPRRRQTQTLWAYIPAWANLHWRQGETELAEKEVRLKLQQFPSDPVANFILGQILLNNSQLEEADSCFPAAPKANPRYEAALFGLERAEIARNHPEAAIEPLRKAIQIDPDYAEAHFVLGTALRQAGRAAEGSRNKRSRSTYRRRGGRRRLGPREPMKL
jgi:tetratricopeptide (TPR) repeat protein